MAIHPFIGVMKMHCNDMSKQLTGYARGEISQPKRLAMQRHLQQCAACRARLADLDPVAAALLKAPETPPAPERLAHHLMQQARLRSRQTAVATLGPIAWWRTATVAMRSAAMLALMLGLGLGGFLGATANSARVNEQPMESASHGMKNLYAFGVLGDFPNTSLAASYLSLLSQDTQGTSP